MFESDLEPTFGRLGRVRLEGLSASCLMTDCRELTMRNEIKICMPGLNAQASNP